MKALITAILFLIHNIAIAQWVSSTPNFGDTISISAIDVLNEDVIWSAGYRQFVKDNEYGPQETDSAYISITKDGGLNWKSNSVPLGKKPIITSICSIDQNTCFIAGLTNYKQAKVLKTIDGGKTWSNAFSPNFGLGNSWVNFIHFFDLNHGIVIEGGQTNGFSIFLTENGGINWTLINSDSIPNSNLGEFILGADAYGDHVWFSTSDARVFRSTNGGISWAVSNTPLQYLLGLSFADQKNGIGSFGYIANMIIPTEMIITSDGGINWDRMNIDALGDSIIVFGYEYIPNSTFILLTTCKGSILTGYFATWVSPDRGITWQQISTGENIHWPTFISPTIGWGGEGQQFSHKTKMFKYTGSPLVGLFSGKTLPQDWSISPNPCVDHFKLEIKSDKTESYMLLINDVQGKLVYTESFVQDGTTPVPVNFGKLSAGNYVVTLLSKEGKAAKWMVVAE